MISSVSIGRFGLFQNFIWDEHFPKPKGKEDFFFNKVNVIYGRNYSGKTTLARLFKCLEDGFIHPDYDDASFSFTTHDDNAINEQDLSSNSSKVCCRVYSTDFVRENLSWLHNTDGSIKPFTILGSANVEIEKQISEISQQLGGTTLEEGGLHYQCDQKIDEYNRAENSHKKSQKNLETALSKKAKEIKENTRKYDQVTYSITHLRRDIPDCLHLPDVTSEQISEYERTLEEKPLTQISLLATSNPKLRCFLKDVNTLLAKRISPSEPISELLDDPLLQEWVRQGIDHHRNKRESCAFCGGDLPETFWNKIDAHFSKESDEFRKLLKGQIEAIESAKGSIGSYIQLRESQFYSCYSDRFLQLQATWKECSAQYAASLELLIQALKMREQDVFLEPQTMSCDDYTEQICKILAEFNELIEDNNSKTATLSADQEKARTALRHYDLRAFLRVLKYESIIKNLEEQDKEVKKLKTEASTLKQMINDLSERQRELEAQAKDESRGAELVNTHLSRFFGHDELKLVAENEDSGVRFQIFRQGHIATNLSEGECSLISFCYFIAKMEDELQSSQTSDNLLIFIDDPISSLDGNHIFFMFSLIDTVIVKPMKFGQLFISTHNLDFLRYMKRLKISGKGKSMRHYMIERRRDGDKVFSTLCLMPVHLKNFATEFNYLFEQIYLAVHGRSGSQSQSHDVFYNLPNNMRKFLECYLFYKFPDNTKDPLTHMDELFDGHAPSLINRIVNEYSHLTQFGRAWQPMDTPELEECARIILDKIKSEDARQFQALVDGISS